MSGGKQKGRNLWGVGKRLRGEERCRDQAGTAAEPTEEAPGELGSQLPSQTSNHPFGLEAWHPALFHSHGVTTEQL